jgi:hypothetical protein
VDKEKGRVDLFDSFASFPLFLLLAREEVKERAWQCERVGE